ncbi:MAG: hypothetical protein VYB54_11885 [Pseudomonadota bacterium]|nr:hypothetical protein [Pseudomonadota bacterium]
MNSDRKPAAWPAASSSRKRWHAPVLSVERTIDTQSSGTVGTEGGGRPTATGPAGS